jgi:hypothetical protein
MARVCARSTACTGRPLARLQRLVDRVRRHRLTGSRLVNGKRARQPIGISQLFQLVAAGGVDPVIWRELDATVRAALHGDTAPLARLAGDSALFDDPRAVAARYLDDELYAAVWCTEMPEPYSLTASPAARAAQLRRAIVAQPAGAFAPFTAGEWAHLYGISMCLDWPTPDHPLPVVPPGAKPLPASKPVLVLGGDLDSITSSTLARSFAPRLGANVRFVDLRNTTHGTSLGSVLLTIGATCGQSIISRFIADPGRLQSMNTSCAGRIPPIQTPGLYPRTLASAPAATVVAGHASPTARRAAWVAAQTVADALVQSNHSFATATKSGWYVGNASGLRGGTFRVGVDRDVLRDDRFVADATATGSFSSHDSPAQVFGTITIHYRGHAYPVHVAWRERSRYARARVPGATLKLPSPGGF